MTNKHKIALVTGASRGIGQAIACELGRQGMQVVGTATTQQGVDSINNNFNENGLQGMGVIMNVCDTDSITAALSQISESIGAPTILVNNAGITQDNIFLRMKPQQWDDVIDTNLNGLYRVTKACLKPMLKQRWGRVVSISSVVGASGSPGQANYCAAKAGVVGFTKSLAIEMAAYGMTFNVVAPGFIDTDMTASLAEQKKDSILGQIPIQKMGTPEDIAYAVKFLVSDEAAYITGQTLHVNGGMYMG